MSEVVAHSRALAIWDAVRREIEARRAHLDAAADLGAVTIEVKLTAGTAVVRGVVWQEERVCRATR